MIAPAALPNSPQVSGFEAIRDPGVPAMPGTYALVMLSSAELSLKVGRLDAATLTPGLYVYVGSALGSGGLKARVSRHLMRGKIPHWHVDYLTEVLPVLLVCFVTGPARLECAWINRLCCEPDASVPICGFGSSDCRGPCRGHLVRLPTERGTEVIGSLLWGRETRGDVLRVGTPVLSSRTCVT